MDLGIKRMADEKRYLLVRSQSKNPNLTTGKCINPNNFRSRGAWLTRSHFGHIGN